MAKQLFREKSLKYISSPEQINDYLKVTKPGVWAVLVAIIVLLVGLVIWGHFAYIGTIDGYADVEDGIMVMYFNSPEYASSVKEGMKIQIGESISTIDSVGKDDDGYIFAVAETNLSDGIYEATVTYKQTQVISLLVGN